MKATSTSPDTLGTVGQRERPLSAENFSQPETWSFFCGLLGPVLSIGIAISCAATPLGSIGAALGQGADGRLFVREIPPGQAADKAGLQLDDEIKAIDGKPVVALTQDEVRLALRGDVGTTMTLTVERYGQKRDVKVLRTPLEKEKK